MTDKDHHGISRPLCPSCRVRMRVPDRTYPTNYSVLQVNQSAWEQLRKAAESFDKAASNVQEEESQGGTGDGETLFTAADFIEWIKPDCSGFKVTTFVEADGAPAMFESGRQTTTRRDNAHRHPDPIPYVSRRTA